MQLMHLQVSLPPTGRTRTRPTTPSPPMAAGAACCPPPATASGCWTTRQDVIRDCLRSSKTECDCLRRPTEPGTIAASVSCLLKVRGLREGKVSYCEMRAAMQCIGADWPCRMADVRGHGVLGSFSFYTAIAEEQRLQQPRQPRSGCVHAPLCEQEQLINATNRVLRSLPATLAPTPVSRRRKQGRSLLERQPPRSKPAKPHSGKKRSAATVAAAPAADVWLQAEQFPAATDAVRSVRSPLSCNRWSRSPAATCTARMEYLSPLLPTPRKSGAGDRIATTGASTAASTTA